MVEAAPPVLRTGEPPEFRGGDVAFGLVWLPSESRVWVGAFAWSFENSLLSRRGMARCLKGSIDGVIVTVACIVLVSSAVSENGWSLAAREVSSRIYGSYIS